MKAQTPANETALEALGRFLKEEREKVCLTRSDVSTRTKISIDQITYLEEGKFNKMATVYARGFLRSYCDLLALDTNSVMAEFKRLTKGHEEDNTRIIKHVPNNLGSGEPRGHTAWTVLGLMILLAGLLAAGLYMSPSLKKTVTSYLPGIVAEKLGLAENQAAGQASQSSAGFAAPAAQSANPPAAAANPALAVATTALSSATQVALAQNDAINETFSGRLTLRAEASTWAQVTVAAQPVEHLLFEAGQLHSFEGEKLITVVCGDGRALRTEWNGQDRGPLGSEGPVEVFFNLGPGGSPSANPAT